MSRLTFAVLALSTIGVGLALHRGGGGLPPALRDIAGDALYGAMVAWWVGAAAPRAVLWRRAFVAYGLCAGIELSQLVREPHTDALRATPVGHLVLGSDFDPRDLASYACGVAGAVLLERALVRRPPGVRSGKWAFFHKSGSDPNL